MGFQCNFRPQRLHSRGVRLGLSLVFLWRLTYFALPVCFQGGFLLLSTNRRATGAEKIVLRSTSSHLLPYCDDTNRAAGLRGWLSGRAASGARVTSCSHSRFEGKTIANFSPTLPFTAALARFCHPDFLGRRSRSVRPSKGSLVYCRPLWAPQRTVLLHIHDVQLSRLARLQRRRLFCRFCNYPMALDLARDDPLAGAFAFDAYFHIVGERACAPMEKGMNGFWARPFGCPELPLLFLVFL